MKAEESDQNQPSLDNLEKYNWKEVPNYHLGFLFLIDPKNRYKTFEGLRKESGSLVEKENRK